MNYFRLATNIGRTSIVLFLFFYFSLEKGESFIPAHFLWLLVAFGVEILFERRRYQKEEAEKSLRLI